MSAQPAAANNYGLPPVRKWLSFVDDQLSPDGVEFLKLGLYPDVDYKKMESIHKPSQLYDAILEQRPHEEKEVLRLFVHALRQIGGDLRGKFLTDSLPNYSLAMPGPLTSGETQTDFKFFQCLVKIGTKVRGTEVEPRLKQHFARQLNVHHIHIANIPNLFIRLHQAGIVTSERHQKLVHFLGTHGLSRKCLPYLDKFRQETGLTPLEGLGSPEEGDQAPSSSNPESLVSSCQVTDDPIPTATKATGGAHVIHLSSVREGRGSMQVRGSAGYAGVPDSSSDPAAEAPLLNETVTTTDKDGDSKGTSGSDGDCETASNAEPDEPLIPPSPPSPPPSPPPPPPPPQRKTISRIYCLASLLTVIVITVGMILGLGLGVWWRLASPHSTSMLVREGDTIILSQVSTFFDQLVSTMEVARIGESPHVIDVYLVKSDCYHLPITSTSQTTESSNFINVTYYLMPESRIHYNICATSNFSVTERIHLVILDNLEESRTFNPTTDESFAYFKNIHVGRNGKTECNTVHYTVNYEGYYTLLFYLPEQPLSYEYESMIVVNSIDISSAVYELNCTIDEDHEQCNLPLTFGLTEQCLVAVIRNRTDKFHSTYVHANVVFERRLDQVLGITVTVASIPLIISVLVGIAIIYNVKKPRQISEQSVEMTEPTAVERMSSM